MIESAVVRNVPEMAQFIIDSLCDSDFRTKMDAIPNILEKGEFDVEGFFETLESESKFELVPSNTQNDSILFIELAIKGDLNLTIANMNRLKKIAAS